MGPKVRRELIQELAQTAGLASVEELSSRFGVTPSTIRRDLAVLAQQGGLARTYGGAMAVTAHPEPSLRERLGEAHQEKAAIAGLAAQLVEPGEVVALDGGSTVGALAHVLADHPALTVVTSALDTMQELSGSEGVVVECLGGRLRDVSGSLVGPIAESALERMTFDRVFLGADGVDPELGICEAGREQTRLKELMARRSAEVLVLADASKLLQRPFHAWAGLGEGWTLVTDDRASQSDVDRFERAGVQVRVASPSR